MDSLTSTLARYTTLGTPYKEVVPLVYELTGRMEESMFIPNVVWHATGFLAIELSRSVDPAIIRLHIWPTQERVKDEPDWDIHSHVWHFHSYTLAGEITDRTYEVKNVSNGLYQLYEAHFNWDNSQLVATGQSVSYCVQDETTYIAGQSHSIPRNLYHTTHVPKDTLTATLVVMTNPSPNAPYVIGDIDGLPSYPRRPRRCDTSTYKFLLSQLRFQLEKEL
jgi:hypothetical protein